MVDDSVYILATHDETEPCQVEQNKHPTVSRREHASSKALPLFATGRFFSLIEFDAAQTRQDYIGHQAREIFTHLLVTIPAAWGLCLLLARRTEDSNIPERSAPHWWTLFAVATGVVGALLGAAVCLASLMVDSASHGQSADLAILLFPHFFEHGFGYLVVPVMAALVYELANNPSE
jgi:hypothetical protein